MSEGTGSPPVAATAAPAEQAAEPAQPPRAIYRCESGSSLTIENLRTSVVVIDASGSSIGLPSSPAGSRARYGSGAYALVLEGNEALWMRAGKTPDTCVR